MSYCVNCGVELDSSAAKCALCSTPVINPNVKEKTEKDIPPFSDETFIPKELSYKAKRRIILSAATAILLIPSIVCLLLNLTVFKGSLWSVAVCSTAVFLWSAFVLPFCTKKPKPYVLWAADSVMACVNVLVYVWLLGGSLNFFTVCLLPIIAVNSFIVLLYMLWLRKKRHIILKVAFVFLAVAVSCLSCGCLLFSGGVLRYGVQIGIICFVSFAALFGFFMYFYSSKTIRKWASKRFFF